MSFHIPCFQDQMSVSFEAGGAADNVCCFTFNSAGSLWLSKVSTIPVFLNIVRTVFIFTHEGDDGIKAVAWLPGKWKTKGVLAQLTLCCSSHSAELHSLEMCVLSTACSCEIQSCASAPVSSSMAQSHMAACQHSGHGGASTKHTCTILLWFHGYPQLLSFKRHEINGLTSDIQRALSRIYLF